MKRRLTIARSLVNDPEVLLLDEPTTGLDPQARHTVWDRLFRLKQRGVTLILTTHYMDEAEQLCDRLVVMDKGKIAAEGSPLELIRRYSTREVVELRFRGENRPEEVAAELKSRLDGFVRRLEALPDRLLLYTDDGDATASHIHELGLQPGQRARPPLDAGGRLPPSHRPDPGGRLSSARAPASCLRVLGDAVPARLARYGDHERHQSRLLSGRPRGRARARS